jgi:hypothetical protein
LHRRTVTCEAFERDDDLIEIEGTLLDVKPHPFVLRERGMVNPGEAIHQMKLVIAIDRGFVIHDARAVTLNSPYRICSAINEDYRKIIGMQIGPGFTRQVKRMFHGILGCSHMTELLPSMATTAFQAVWSSRKDRGQPNPSRDTYGQNSPFDGCHALRRDGDLVRNFFPQQR